MAINGSRGALNNLVAQLWDNLKPWLSCQEGTRASAALWGGTLEVNSVLCVPRRPKPTSQTFRYFIVFIPQTLNKDPELNGEIFMLSKVWVTHSDWPCEYELTICYICTQTGGRSFLHIFIQSRMSSRSQKLVLARLQSRRLLWHCMFAGSVSSCPCTQGSLGSREH